MATTAIVLDSNVLIEFLRKANKADTVLFRLTYDYLFSVSVITLFELQIGIRSDQHQQDYQTLMSNFEVLSIDEFCITKAVEVYRFLKSRNAQVELTDLLIGATAIRYNLPLATLNQKHFEQMASLQLVDLTLYQK